MKKYNIYLLIDTHFIYIYMWSNQFYKVLNDFKFLENGEHQPLFQFVKKQENTITLVCLLCYLLCLFDTLKMPQQLSF